MESFLLLKSLIFLLHTTVISQPICLHSLLNSQFLKSSSYSKICVRAFPILMQMTCTGMESSPFVLRFDFHTSPFLPDFIRIYCCSFPCLILFMTILQVWNPKANQEGYAPSAVEVLRILDETLDAFFQLPIPTHPALLPDLMAGLDRCLQYYVTKAKSGCGKCL